MDELTFEAVLPHEKWAELERDDLQERKKRPKAMPARLPATGGGESTSKQYLSARLSIPLTPTILVPLLATWVLPVGFAGAMAATTGGGSSNTWTTVLVIASLIGLLTLGGIIALWIFRDPIAEWWAGRRAEKLRGVRRDLIMSAFGRNCHHMTQVGVRYGLQRSEPLGSFHDFIGFVELMDHGIEVWWAKGKQAGGFLIPRSWIVRVWPVEIWTKGAAPSPVGPPGIMVPYVEYQDPRSQTPRIFSFESAEEVSPDSIAEASRRLGDQICLWLYGKTLSSLWVPPAGRQPKAPPAPDLEPFQTDRPPGAPPT